MTEKLKTLLHEQAETVDFAALDLDAITAVGDRRVRRRRGGAVVVGALAALAVVGGVGVVALSGDDGGPQVAVDPLPTGLVSWATGSTIHAGDEQADVGHLVAAYVVTTEGYVLTDGEGAVWSYVDGRVDRVGTVATKRARLVGDADGSLVGWVDPSADAPTFVVVDTATGDVTTLDTETSAGMGSLADEKDPAYLYAIDGRTAYLRDERGAVGIDVDSGEVVWQDASARNGFDLVAAEDGVVAQDGDDDRGLVLSGPAGDVTLGVYGSQAYFSPSGRWISIDADEPQVYDATTGQQVPVDIGDRFFGTGYAWLGDDTLVMIAARTETGPVELLTCAVPAGSCEQAAEFGDFDAFTADHVLPFGETFED